MYKPLWSLLLVFACLNPVQLRAGDPYDNIRYNRNETFNYDDTQDKPWQEEGLTIPPPPADRDLVEVHIDSLGDSFTVWVDTKTLSLGKDDRVVRYWLVLRSKTGAANTMYEGIRCSSREYKTYAFANQRGEGQVEPVKNPKWLPTKGARGMQFRQELQEGYFCSFGMEKKRDEILHALQEANRGFYFGTGKSSGPSAFY